MVNGETAKWVRGKTKKSHEKVPSVFYFLPFRHLPVSSFPLRINVDMEGSSSPV